MLDVMILELSVKFVKISFTLSAKEWLWKSMLFMMLIKPSTGIVLSVVMRLPLLFKLFSSLKQKVDNLETRLNSVCDGILPEQLAKSIDAWINDVTDQLDSKVKQILIDIQDLKDQVSSSETKLDTAIEAKLVDSVSSIKKDLEPAWACIVNKEVTN
jgi:hypothetical protein